MTTETPGGTVPPIEPTPVVAAQPAASVPPPPPPAPAAPAAPAVDPYAAAPAYAAPPTVQPYQQPYGYAQQPGQPYAQGYYAPAYAQAPVGPRGLSITSMVLGIVGVVFGIFYGLGLFPAIAGIITGHLAQRRQPAGKGFWIAGLICSYVGLLLSLIGVAIVVFVIIAISSNGGFANIGTDSYNLGNN